MAPPPNTPSNAPSVLRATYSAPADPSSSTSATPTTPQSHTFTQAISSSLPASDAVDSTTARTAYISELRGAVTKVQAEINTFLTEKKMEEDKLALGGNNNNTAGGGGKGRRKKEEEEEENYGEEVAGEDDDDETS